MSPSDCITLYGPDASLSLGLGSSRWVTVPRGDLESLDLREAAKKLFFNGRAIKTLRPPPSTLMAVEN